MSCTLLPILIDSPAWHESEMAVSTSDESVMVIPSSERWYCLFVLKVLLERD